MLQTEKTSATVAGAAQRLLNSLLVSFPREGEEEEQVVVVFCPYMKSTVQSQ